MFVPSQAQFSLQVLSEAVGKTPLTFLHPFPHDRAWFIQQFVRPELPVLYGLLPTSEQGVAEWLSELVGQWTFKVPAVTRIAVEVDSGQAGRALAAALTAAFPAGLLLFLDDVDRPSLTGALADFLAGLLAGGAGRVQVLLPSSLLLQPFAQAQIAQGNAIVLGWRMQQRRPVFVREDPTLPQIMLKGFDGGRVWVNDRALDPWEGALPRLLCCYLIDQPLLGREQIFADFWPLAGLHEATDVFHVTKHKTTELLSRAADTSVELTQYKQGFYLPNPGVIRHYDVALFTGLVAEAEAAADDRAAELLLHRALLLYREPFLHGMQQPWIVRRRAELERLYSDALIRLAAIDQHAGRPTEARRRLEQAIVLRPEREDLYHSLIALYRAHGQLVQAERLYERLLSTIYTPLGLRPPAVLRETVPA